MSSSRWLGMLGCGDQLTADDVRRLRRFNLWVLVYALSFVGSMWLMTLFDDLARPIEWGLITLSTAFGLTACWAYLRFLREADELLRKIQLEGLALGFGAAAIFMMGYALAEQAGAPELSTSDPLVVMLAAWALGQWLGTRRYQ